MQEIHDDNIGRQGIKQLVCHVIGRGSHELMTVKFIIDTQQIATGDRFLIIYLLLSFILK